MISLSLEASTVFLNMRYFTFEFKITNSLIPLINSSLLFVTYFAFRVAFQSYLSYSISTPEYWRNMKVSTEDILKLRYDPLGYRSGWTFVFIVNTLSQIINLYWFKLIIAQVTRNIKKVMGNEAQEGNKKE